jgi:hypothetical protein
MATTYIPLYTTTLASAAASVTISPISGAYTDLVLVCNYATSASTGNALLTFNSDTTALYSETALIGNGTSATSSRDSAQNNIPISWFGTNSTSDRVQLIYNIQNYSNATTFKTTVGRFNLSERGTGAIVGLYRSTNAINSLTITNSNNNFAAGSTFSLYGVASASVGAKATGGIISNDGAYYYHTFLSSGTFTPTQNLSNVDYLVVAGGGGGSSSGGGAGGLRCTVDATGGGGTLESRLSLTSSTAYTVTVGAGGAGASNGQIALGSDGSSSSIAGTGLTTISTVGGGGGVYQIQNSTPGRTGGSGSGGYTGGGLTNPGTNTGGAGTANQGFAGGAAGPWADATSSSGGGGGAGAVGGTAPSVNSAGVGGNGVTTSISGTSTTYAGGGGGGIYVNGAAKAGGTGGGGLGSTNNAAGSSGTANRGGGGGGFYSETYKNAAYSGGSGLVIVRYPI